MWAFWRRERYLADVGNRGTFVEELRIWLKYLLSGVDLPGQDVIYSYSENTPGRSQYLVLVKGETILKWNYLSY